MFETTEEELINIRDFLQELQDESYQSPRYERSRKIQDTIIIRIANVLEADYQKRKADGGGN